MQPKTNRFKGVVVGEPVRATSVMGGLPFVRIGRPEKAREFLIEAGKAVSEARRACLERRDRVLAHEWSRKRLCQIFRYTSAHQWNGFVPPRLLAPDDKGGMCAKNTSEARTALMELLVDVAEFEKTGRIPFRSSAGPEGRQLSLLQGEE